MFIEISDSIVNELLNEDSKQKQDLEKMFFRCAFAIEENHHFICTESEDMAEEVYKYFEKDKKYGFIANAFYYIKRNFTSWASEKYNLKFYVSIGFYDESENETRIKSDNPSCEIFRLNMDWAYSSEFWQKVALFPENIVDCNSYEAILMFQRENAKNGSYKFGTSFLNAAGGGSGTYLMLETWLKEKRMCFAILDSDKKTPESSLGDTATKVKKNKYLKKYKDIFWIILNVHEIENLFFSEDFARIVEYDENTIECVKEIDKKKGYEKFSGYFDVKKGITFRSYNGIKLESEEEKIYLQDATNFVKDKVSEHFDKNGEIIKTCGDKDKKCSDCESCKQKILKGQDKYLSNLFRKISDDSNLKPLDYVKSEIFKAGYKTLSEYIKGEWKRLFEFLKTVCCAKQINGALGV